jgi:hypothetical protein
MKSTNLGFPPHSIGHTSTGKTIYDQIGSPSQFRTACIKWTSKDHLEAHQVILEKIRKGYFSKSLVKDPDLGFFKIGYQFDLKKSNDENYINYIADMHLEMAKTKKS